MKKIFLISALAGFGFTGFAQTPATDLDFWVGDWILRWQDSDSTEATGSNSITRELDGKVLCEHYEALSGKNLGFVGRSWSVYDVSAGMWKQTWVDNQGAYLDFTGGKEGDTFVFRRQFATKAGKIVHQKMVFRDIRADRFTWDWLRSDDGGRSWQTAWQIFYTRR